MKTVSSQIKQTWLSNRNGSNFLHGVKEETTLPESRVAALHYCSLQVGLGRIAVMKRLQRFNRTAETQSQVSGKM